MNQLIAPSLLAADFGHVADEVAMVNGSNADWLHLDVMDGVFVPNISFGFPVLEAVSKLSTKPLDVHLMIVQPERYVRQVQALGTYMMTVHYEACTHLHRTLFEIHEAGMKAGVALNPSTPVSMLKDVIEDIDMVLVMTVNPGFGGQKFIEHSLDKVREARELIASSGSQALVEVDGGVTLTTAPRLIEAGVNVLVTGSTVFRASNPSQMISTLKEL
ncbi:MAG: ribulose-phosphate 3-epimerase [Bacteroidaceae bacterium]|nr:ribulose-phosphate 3-epimerase [Bacteroidaceae bacterium]MBP5323205.1 ribulose-phosphate 3-epimerase [Bacteroidaceae bacterium]